MGESTCLLHQQPFCYASGIPNEPNQSNLIHALGQSISFGRFGQESLEWEKWSSFPHKRYVEEAERYSRPGSVAEKKAFFEAHYKKLAAQKAAALLEQANNAASNNATNQEHDHSAHQTSPTSEAVHQKEQEDNKVASFEPDCLLSNSSSDRLEECQPLMTDSMKVESQNQLEDVLTQKDKSEKLSGNYEDEVLASTSTEKPPASSLKSLMSAETSKFYLTPTKPISHKKESIMRTPIISKKPALSSVDRGRPTIFSTPISTVDKKKLTTNSTPIGTVDKKRSTGNSTPIRTVDKKISTVNSTPISTVDKKRSTVNYTPTNSVDKRSTANFTPTSSTADRKRSTVNFSPIRELNRLTASVMRKFEGARVGNASSKTTKDSSTPLRTPTMASKNQLQKPPALTPLTEKRRTKTPVASLASSSNTAGPKWRLPMPSTENKVRSPIISSPFSLRTEERAATRKKKLEEKFNDNEAHKVQLHTKLKEKAETEIRRLRQSLCFKARPLPDFYKERMELKNEIDKCQLTHPELPKQEKRPTTSRLWVKSCATQRSAMKNNGTKNYLETNEGSFNHHLTSYSKMIAQENASPNVQHGNQNGSNHRESTQRLVEQITPRRCRKTWHKI